MKTLLVVVLLMTSGRASACLYQAVQENVFFKDLPAPATARVSEKASIMARITVIEPKNGVAVTGVARVDEVLRGSLPEKTVRFVVADRSSCRAYAGVGDAGLVLGNMTPDGMLSLLSARNNEIYPERYVGSGPPPPPLR